MGHFVVSLGLALAIPIFAVAAPVNPDTLPGQIVGVVGSGDQLSLQIADGSGARTLKIGAVYGDGWVLSGLDATRASLTKDGQTRYVGLNPTGVLARPSTDPPASTIEVTAQKDAEILAGEMSSGRWDGQPYAGKTQEETRRYVLANAWLAKMRQDGVQPTLAQMASAFPDIFGSIQLGGAQAKAIYDRVGSISLYVPPGGDRNAVIAKAGLQGAYFLPGAPDVRSGVTLTVADPTSSSATPEVTLTPSDRGVVTLVKDPGRYTASGPQ